MEIGTLFTPDTILRWHRQLVASKWDYSDRRKAKPGRPRIGRVIVDLVLRFAKENPSWGFDRIQGALANVGYQISDTTVGNILKAHGIEPAPKNLSRCAFKFGFEVSKRGVFLRLPRERPVAGRRQAPSAWRKPGYGWQDADKSELSKNFVAVLVF